MYYFSTEDYLSDVYKTPQQAYQKAKEIFEDVKDLQQNEWGCYYFECKDGIIDICNENS